MALSGGDEVVRPVCLMKWGGRFVFADEGSYQIKVSMTFVDVVSGAVEIADAAPCVVRVVRVGDVPQAYIDFFSDLPDICGCFRYGVEYCSVLDMEKLSFGEYDESLYAYMNYQAWTMSLTQLLFRTKKPMLSPTYAERGMALSRSRLGDRECRGHWIFERLASMRTSKAGLKSIHELQFSDGDIAF